MQFAYYNFSYSDKKNIPAKVIFFLVCQLQKNVYSYYLVSYGVCVCNTNVSGRVCWNSHGSGVRVSALAVGVALTGKYIYCSQWINRQEVKNYSFR